LRLIQNVPWLHNLEAQRGKKVAVPDADLLIAAVREILDLLLASGAESGSRELFEMIQEREPISRGKTRRR
jgi:hypothetical protein